MEANQLKTNLRNFIGSETLQNYNFFAKKVLLTEGVVYLAENAGCYWLIDLIMSAYPQWKEEEFVSVKLSTKDNEGKVIIDDGNGRVLYEQVIPYTDFPLEKVTLYLVGGVLMLSSEY